MNLQRINLPCQLSLSAWVVQFYNKKTHEELNRISWTIFYCKPKSLLGKLRVLGPKISRIAGSSKIEPDNHYLTLENRYDKFGEGSYDLITLHTKDVMGNEFDHFTISVKYNAWTVWTTDNNEVEPVVENGTVEDVMKYFEV